MKTFTLTHYVSVDRIKSAFGYTSALKTWVLLLTISISALSSFGQVVPVVTPTGGFNINGGITARAGSGDWTTGSGGTGFVLDNNGNPLNTFTTGFTKDAYNGGDNIFTGSKFGDNPANWRWEPNKKAGGKGDINNAAFHLSETITPNQQWLFISGDRLATNGESDIYFELFQNTLTANSNGTFTSGGLQGGRTANDIVISMKYVNGGSVPEVKFYLWKETGGAGSGVWSFEPTSYPAGSVIAKTNVAGEIVPYGAFGNPSYTTNQFVEVALNVTTLFSSFNLCEGLKIKTILISTKSSDVDQANLDDFVEPFQVRFDLGTAEISYDGSLCRVPFGVATVTQTGISGGTYSSTTGLVINSSTGAIDLPASTPGSYTVTYTYFTPVCSIEKTATTIVVIPTPVIPALVSKTDINCFGGSTGAIDISVSGGTAPYTYAWTGPGVNSSTQDQTGLGTGTYKVIVSDSKGCPSEELSVTLNQPASALQATLGTKKNVTCNAGTNGEIDINVSGGTAGYNYVWTKNGNPISETTQDLMGIGAGNYYVTVTDSKGCTANVSVSISQPDAIVFRVPEITNAKCFGSNDGQIIISATGGTGTITYSISPNIGAQSPSGTFTGLTAQTYTVTATDANGCSKQTTATVNQSAVLMSLSAVPTAVTCTGAKNGAVNLSVTGGTGPFTYEWTGPESFTANTEDISTLAGGTYNVTVTDAYGCVKTTSATVNESAVLLSLDAVPTAVTCKDAKDGKINLTITGGTATYYYCMDRTWWFYFQQRRSYRFSWWTL